ncbi:hypothetical protein [Pseudomonas brassicacearum]|uniref:hypothetical protein n=1 Tax=Pseudomonas brassicacearum TaxID=930166 RepID=UPI001618AA75|nr:hypothetical protein [Pseudomonas brassicacearum]
MKALVVYEHPEQASFNAALKNTAVETLTRLGHEADYYAAESKAVAAGLTPVLRGRLPNINGFTYFDPAEHGSGVTLQVRAVK